MYVGICAECIDMLIRERRTGHGIAARGKFENNLAQWTMRLCVCCIASGWWHWMALIPWDDLFENSCSRTLWLFNIAMENGPFIDVFPIKTSIYKGFSIAMLNDQMVGLPLADQPTHDTSDGWVWSPPCTVWGRYIVKPAASRALPRFSHLRYHTRSIHAIMGT